MFRFLLPAAILAFTFTEAARPMIIQVDGGDSHHSEDSDVGAGCTSWRVAEEANNLLPWRTIPRECADYVKRYMTGKEYLRDLQLVNSQAAAYARSLNLSGDGRSVWIFDVDETILSNLPYYARHAYGLEHFNATAFDEWTELGVAPPIVPTLELYEEVLRLGFKAVLLTGRSDTYRNITAQNLLLAGYKDWEMLLMRTPDESGISATRYKSSRRKGLIDDGYRILGNSGDQWSDLLDSSMADRSFKLPNPMYFIS